MHFKVLKGSPKGKVQGGQYLLVVGLGSYKWYQSQTPDDVLAFSLFPEGGQTQGGVPVRTLGPKRVDLAGVPSIGERNDY